MPPHRAAGRSATAHAWAGRLRRRGPVCLILERLPEVILEHILAQLPAWYLAQSVSTCKAFRAHACAAAKVRALALQLPPWPMPKGLGADWPSEHPWPMPKNFSDASGWAGKRAYGCEGLFCRLHLLETVGDWFCDVICADPEQYEKPAMLLQHRSTGARVNLEDERVCDGCIRFQRTQDAPWEVVDCDGDLNQISRNPPEAAHEARLDPPPCWYTPWECYGTERSDPLPDCFWLLCLEYTSSWKNWHVSLHPRGLEIVCLGDAREVPIPSLLTADGAVLKGYHTVGSETELDPGAFDRRPLDRQNPAARCHDLRAFYVRLREDPDFYRGW